MSEPLSHDATYDALIALLTNHCGQRGQSEGAADTLRRIIRERDSALTLLRQRDSKAAHKVEQGL